MHRREQLEEAIRRAELLNLRKDVMNDLRRGVINKSEQVFVNSLPGERVFLFSLSKQERDMLRGWEEKTGNLVYHFVNKEVDGARRSYLLSVSGDKSLWEREILEVIRRDVSVTVCSELKIDEAISTTTTMQSTNGGLSVVIDK